MATKYESSKGEMRIENPRDMGSYDVLIVGGGHNGLTAATYLAKKSYKVLVLERRHITGGASVTEEMVPGFKFSRGAYLAGLLRPDVIKDLDLERHGMKYIPRDPSSFTPTHVDGPFKGKSLMMGSDEKMTWDSVAQFSKADADALFEYEEFLGKARDIVQPLLDGPMPNIEAESISERREHMKNMWNLLKVGYKHKKILVPFYDLFTGPATTILDRWFEGDVLKTTLATDAVIGSLNSPTANGSAYVLLHHVMGEAAGRKGVWAYVEGGMGAISNAMAAAAKEAGVSIATNVTVKRILTEKDGSGNPKVVGVELKDNTIIRAKNVISNANAMHTFMELLDHPDYLPNDYYQHIKHNDYSCGVFKINCAVDSLPNFLCLPNSPDGKPGPQHRGTVHFENFMSAIIEASREASLGIPATTPLVEMTIPSALDKTLAPPGKHVVQFFIQYAPYHVDPKVGSWADKKFTEAFADRVFSIVDKFCPGFSKSVIGRDILSPLDLERIFGLEQGNIFHGALSLHQIGYMRPAPGYGQYGTPINGLYLCGAGTHPGGGVMGAAGRNCAKMMLHRIK